MRRAKVTLKLVMKPGQESEETEALLIRLQKRTFGQVFHPDYSIRRQYWWLVYVGKQVAGYCSIYQYPDQPETWFLSLAGTLPKFRGLGIQKRMIRHRMRFAKRRNAGRLITYTSIDNVISANNLTHCGFKLYVPKWQWGLSGAIYLQKKFV